MIQLLLIPIIELLAISPLIAIALNRSDDNWKSLIVFIAYYFAYTCLLTFPTLIPALKIIESDWNWSGKIYAIGGSILFYMLFRKTFADHNYITFKQYNTSLKPKLLAIIIVFLVVVGLAILSINTSAIRLEYFIFQFTMPGLDEEIAYRAIMLGLLSKALTSKIHVKSRNLGNPALIITSILFGLAHSFHIDQDWCFHQNWVEFLSTFATGLLLGWLTTKSGSILMSILIHGLINVIPLLIVWSK